MDYEKKYKESVEKLRYKISDNNGNIDYKAVVNAEELQEVFPELAESEDERVRKWIIDDIMYNMNNEPLNNSEYKKQAQKALAWLEKQGEQKPTDKVEPKFKVGYWITDGYVGGKITSIEDNYPCYKIADFVGGISTSIPFTLQDNYHLWTIQDAKDGDVLSASDGSLFIFAKVKDNAACFHFSLCEDGSKEISDGNHAWETANSCQPATKEQHDLLFSEMKDAGYEWDDEKKELKKTEKQVPKPKWNEEDEQYLLVCKNALKKYDITDKWDSTIIIRWLENKIKQRMEEQQ